MATKYGNFYALKVPTAQSPYRSMIYFNNSVFPKVDQTYKLHFKARGTGTMWTYVYGNNSNGVYVDNGHKWILSNEWKDYEQSFPTSSVPVGSHGLSLDIRTIQPLQGEITDIEFIPT